MRTRGALFALMIAALTLAGGERYAAADNQPIRVLRIDILCREPIDEEGVRRLLPFQVGDELPAGGLEEARRLVELAGLFESVSITSEDSLGGAVVTLQLKRLPL